MGTFGSHIANSVDPIAPRLRAISGCGGPGVCFSVGSGVIVKVPLAVSVQWPDACVCCGVAHPGETARVRVGVKTTGHTPLGTELGARPRLHVPACSACRRRLQRRNWCRPLVSVGTSMASFMVTAYLIHAMRVSSTAWGWTGDLLRGAGFFVAYIPLMFLTYWLLFPVARLLDKDFEAVQTAKGMLYRFRSEAHAEAFRSVNREAIEAPQAGLKA